jgi:hypothetical protein
LEGAVVLSLNQSALKLREPGPVADELEVEQRWNRLAAQGRWIIAVYRCDGVTKVDVARIKRAHHNDRKLVRIQAEVGHLVHQPSRDLAAVDSRRMLDLPVDRLLWYEVIEDIPGEDASLFQAALEKGLQASRDIDAGEPVTSADVARRHPR